MVLDTDPAEPVLRWGVLGAARIAEHYMVPALVRSPHAVVRAVASRRPQAAQRLASLAHALRFYTDYQALLDDPDIDAVYIALPNTLHAPWTLAALAADKHVLCEKPLTTTLKDAEAIRTVARTAGKVVSEAFMYRFHPQLATLQAHLREGAIGEVHSVEAVLSFLLNDPDDIRMSPTLGGGALLDLGCYVVDAANLIYGGPPIEGFAVRHRGETGVDLHTCGVLNYGVGRTASVTASFLLPWQDSRLTARGEKGSLILDHCFNPGTGEGRLTLLTAAGERATSVHPGVDMYQLTADHFAYAVRGRGEPPVDLDGSLAVQYGLALLANSTIQ